MAQNANAINYFSPAKFVVSKVAGEGTHTTIGAALSAASAGDTLAIMPGTYPENPALIAGINLTAYNCDAVNNVIIQGKCSFSSAGTVSISGIQLQTNSDYALAVTGSAASIVYLNNCNINAVNNTPIDFTSSSSSSEIFVLNCTGDLGTTGIQFVTQSSPGLFNGRYTRITNSGGSTSASAISAGSFNLSYCDINAPFTYSSTSNGTIIFCNINTAATNTTSLTLNGSGQQTVKFSSILSGSSSAISVGGSSVNVESSLINSTNVNAITGSGTLVYNEIAFSGTSSKINTTTLTALNVDLGSLSFDGGTNLLANYAQGTWTPALAFGGSSTGITYTTQLGEYTRIGNVVFFSFQMVLTSKGSQTGSATITGIPITPGTINNPCKMAVSEFNNITLSTTYTDLYLTANSSTATFNISQTGSALGGLAASNTNFANNSDITTTGFYFLS